MKISAIIIAKNEEKKIEKCLESVKWSNEIVLVDTGSNDNTVAIGKRYNAKIVVHKGGSYKDWRNSGLKNAGGDWVLYIDADERVSSKLRNEIKQVINDEDGQYSAYAVPRQNVILGRLMKHGGWWPDYVKRLYKRSDLSKWRGELHEEPVFKGELGHLASPLTHIKHDNISDMVKKTNEWSGIEAKLLYDSNHPRMSWWRFIRIFLTELWFRLIRLGGILDCPEGIIYSFYQAWSRFITYGKLWELQLKYSKKF